MERLSQECQDFLHCVAQVFPVVAQRTVFAYNHSKVDAGLEWVLGVGCWVLGFMVLN
jgi:hypothetical protein